jgi:hypothetical protein
VRNSLKISTIAVVAAMFMTIPGSAATVNIGGTGSGGLLNLGGTDSTDPTADVLTNGSVNGGSPNGIATTNAPKNGSGPTTADLSLGGTGGSGDADGSVLLDLFGTGGGDDAVVALGSGNGTDSGATLDLFGNGGSGGTGGTGGAGSGGSPGTDGLFGPSGGNIGVTSTGGVRVASLDAKANGKCFAPDPTQIAHLTNRHVYTDAMFSSWVSTSAISVIDTRLCDTARRTISNDPNVARLQAFVNGNALVKSTLQKQGRSPSDVIAIDKKGDTLVVYIG